MTKLYVCFNDNISLNLHIDDYCIEGNMLKAWLLTDNCNKILRVPLYNVLYFVIKE